MRLRLYSVNIRNFTTFLKMIEQKAREDVRSRQLDGRSSFRLSTRGACSMATPRIGLVVDNLRQT